MATSPRSLSSESLQPSVESRNISDWELLSMSQVDLSQGSGASTPEDAHQESSLVAPEFAIETSQEQGSVHRAQMDDSFFNGIGVEGFLQADKAPLGMRGSAMQGSLQASEYEVARSHPREEGPHLSWTRADESGVLVSPPKTQLGLSQLIKMEMTDSTHAAQTGPVATGGAFGQSSGLGKEHMQPRDDVEEKESDRQTQEFTQYSDSPVSPLAAPASFGAGTSYASSFNAPQLPRDENEQRTPLGSWMGLQNPIASPDETRPEQESDNESESESDLGSEFSEDEDEPVVIQQPVSAEGGAVQAEEVGENDPPRALQKWFPYEAWWQKQETLRRWVRSVLNHPLSGWSLGLTAAVLGVLYLHQMWRNRDLHAQLRVVNKMVADLLLKVADQERTIRSLDSRRRIPVFRMYAQRS